MDGASNNSASDPGTRTILFSKRLLSPPNDITITICKYYIRQPLTYAKYSMSYSALTDTGFVLHTYFPVSFYKDILISYLTVYNNYGIGNYRVQFTDFTYSNINSHHAYFANVAVPEFSLDNLDATKQFIALYTSAIDITNYDQYQLYKTNYTIVNSNQIQARVYIPQVGTVN